MLRFKCSHCNQALYAKDGTIGKKGKCFQCNEVVVVPSFPESERVVETRQPKSKRALNPSKYKIAPLTFGVRIIRILQAIIQWIREKLGHISAFFKKLFTLNQEERWQILKILIIIAFIGAAAGYFYGGLYNPWRAQYELKTTMLNMALFMGWGAAGAIGMLGFRNFLSTKNRWALVGAAALGGGVWVGIFSAIELATNPAESGAVILNALNGYISGLVIGGLASVIIVLKLSRIMAPPPQKAQADPTTVAFYDSPYSLGLSTGAKVALGISLGCLSLIFIGIGPVAVFYYKMTQKIEMEAKKNDASLPDKAFDLSSIKIQSWTDPITKIKFVYVKGGCFNMGCGQWLNDCDENELPEHLVCLDDFYMSAHEVTLGQWKKFVALSGYQTEGRSDFGCAGIAEPWVGFNNYDDRHPVVCVSWNEANAYAQWLSKKSGYVYRLPTEAEWEYACRSAGKNEKYAGGHKADKAAWHAQNSAGFTNPIGARLPNRLGIHDMSGNVWEWCLDSYNPKAYKAHQRQNPVETSQNQLGESLRVHRGGSWQNQLSDLRCVSRNFSASTDKHNNGGFRLIRLLTEKEKSAMNAGTDKETTKRVPPTINRLQFSIFN
jgi:formylglycine-generating enzyme required for sulfatase activity